MLDRIYFNLELVFKLLVGHGKLAFFSEALSISLLDALADEVCVVSKVLDSLLLHAC